MYMAAAPAYFTANLSVKLKLPAQRFGEQMHCCL
jgi:hypothetical protein